MQITNGSVSRTYKPGDYEGRTVALSFNLDPGESAHDALAHVSSLAEHYARTMPPLITVPAQPLVPPTVAAPGKRQAKAALAVEPVAAPIAAADSWETKGDPLPADGANVPSEQGSAPGSDTASASVDLITDDDLLKAITAKNSDPRKTPAIRALIQEMTGDPLKKVQTLDQPARAEFLKRLEAV